MLTIINFGTQTCQCEEPFQHQKVTSRQSGSLAFKVKELSVSRRAVSNADLRQCPTVHNGGYLNSMSPLQ